MTQGSNPILIAGAGIGGLCAALALQQRGHTVRVFEQASVLGDLGAGLQLAADGTRVLIAMGLQDALATSICPAAWKEVRLWNTGETRKLFDLGADSMTRFGAPYWFVHRGDLHRALRDAVLACDGAAIRVSARVTGFSQDAQGVELQLESGERVAGSLLIGADGVHSRVREQLFESKKPAFTGIVAWRGLVETRRLAPELRRAVGTNWVGPGGHVITYPLRGGELLNFAAFNERDDWTVESWSSVGSRDECHRDFDGWHPLIHAIIDTIDTPYKWALLGREPLRQWSDGRVTLLGDAAHPTLPFLAHGAIMAIEDGYLLARAVAASPNDLPQALRRYQGARIERTSRIVQGSSDNARRFHNPDLADPDKARAYLEREWAPEKVRLRYDWLFEYDATRIDIPD